MSIKKTNIGKDSEEIIGVKSSFLSLIKNLDWRSYVMIAALGLIWLLFAFLTDGIFVSARNITTLFRQMTVVGVIAIGAVIVIITRQIDLSVGSVVALTATVAAILRAWYGWPVIPTVFVAICIGVATGAWHGFLTTKLRIPPFIATLGGMLLFRGIQLLITQGMTIAPTGPSFQWIANGYLNAKYSTILISLIYLVYIFTLLRTFQKGKKYGYKISFFSVITKLVIVFVVLSLIIWIAFSYEGIPIPMLILFGFMFLFRFIMTRTKFGRSLYAIGGNPDAARLFGIKVKANMFFAYVIMGFLTGTAGVILASRLDSASSNIGSFLELDVIAAAVIGGTSLFGGVGTVSGALLGALIMASVDNGMSLMNLSTFIQYVVKAAILLLAVWFDISTTKKQSL